MSNRIFCDCSTFTTYRLVGTPIQSVGFKKNTSDGNEIIALQQVLFHSTFTTYGWVGTPIQSVCNK